MRSSALLVCALASRLLSGPTDAQTATPSLVVVLVVDQMRRDYIQDYGPKWTKGLRRLVDQGAWFTNAAYPYVTTLTCAGHATIGTGTLPSTHGIISNEWWDRATQQAVSCTSDSDAREVPYGDREAGPGGSAQLLQVPTLASAIGKADGRVVMLSLKRASAAMLAGQGRGDAVLWFQGGGWSSSTAWATTPEKSLLRAAERTPIEGDFGLMWDRAAKKSDYKFDDKGLGEKPPDEWDSEMPHALKQRDGKPTTFFYTAWEESPYSDAALGRLATAAIDGMKLGQGTTTDFLAVSFSALDIVGHDFGPRSHEVQDVLLHLDDVVGKVLEQLDKRVGRDKYVLAFTRRSWRRRHPRAGDGRRARCRTHQDGRDHRARQQGGQRQARRRTLGRHRGLQRVLFPRVGVRQDRRRSRAAGGHQARRLVRCQASPVCTTARKCRPWLAATTRSRVRWPPASSPPAAAT